MYRLKLFGIILLMFLGKSAISGMKIPTTNEIDGVFATIDALSIGNLGQKCFEVGLRSEDKLQEDIRQYAFDRLLNIPVATNMLQAAYLLKMKTRWIEKSDRMLGIYLGDCELRKTLGVCRLVQSVSTNNLMELKRRAVLRDVEKWGCAVDCVGRPHENLARWREYRNRVCQWNDAVADHRRRLVSLTCRKYEEIHADVSESERKAALCTLLREFGLPVPESIGDR